MLSYDAGYDSPSIDINLPAAINPADLNNTTQPVSNTNGGSGFSFKNAVGNILGLLEGGAEAYQIVNDKIAGAASKANANSQPTPAVTTISPNNPSLILGLSTNQLILIAGGLAALLIVPRLLKAR